MRTILCQPFGFAALTAGKLKRTRLHQFCLISAAMISAALAGVSNPTPSLAHPHVWISGYEQVVFNPKGKVTAIIHSWIFDQMYSAFVTTGLTKNGVLATRAQLAPLAKTNVESLAEFNYFTFAKSVGVKVRFDKPTGYWLEERPD